MILAGSAAATDVVETFDTNANPSGWSWLSGSPSAISQNGTVQAEGGNPGGWFDSGQYFSDHPNISAFPSPGTPLRLALDSDALTSASVDFERFDSAQFPNCRPFYSAPSFFSIAFVDTHSVITDPPTDIIAYMNEEIAPPSPAGAFPWTNVTFAIPADSQETPKGWTLQAPDGYTWSDMLHNIDAISMYVVNLDDLTFDACWRVGADNIRVSYGPSDETVFADGFDGPV
jgi:hypothetical protein